MVKGSTQLSSLKNLDSINVDYSKGYILEKLIKLKKEISIIITRFDDSRNMKFMNLLKMYMKTKF